MTLVGKILTAVIAFFCLILMGFVLAVYAGHTNWRTKVLDPNTGFKVQLDKARVEKDEVKKRLDTQTTDFSVERKELADRMSDLKTKYDLMAKANEDLKAEKDKLEKERTTNVTAIEATQQTCEALRKEVEGLRKRITEVQAEHDAQFKLMVEATDKLHQKTNEYNALNDKTKSVAADLSKARTVLQKFNLKDNPEFYANVPPEVTGRVTSVRSDGLIEINIGSDSLLNKGHRLEIFRMNANVATYLGPVEVISVEPDRAVAKVAPGQQQGMMQRGDIVASNSRAKLPWPIHP